MVLNVGGLVKIQDRIGNEEIRLRIGLSKKMGGSCLRWFGYVQRRVISALVKKSVDLSWGNEIGRGREIKNDFKRCGKNDMLTKRVIEIMTLVRMKWKKRIHVADFDQLVEDS